MALAEDDLCYAFEDLLSGLCYVCTVFVCDLSIGSHAGSSREEPPHDGQRFCELRDRLDVGILAWMVGPLAKVAQEILSLSLENSSQLLFGLEQFGLHTLRKKPSNGGVGRYRASSDFLSTSLTRFGRRVVQRSANCRWAH